MCSKFTGEIPCQGVISIKLLCNFIEITLCHGCSLVDLQHIFRAPFHKNTYEQLLLYFSIVHFIIYYFESCFSNAAVLYTFGIRYLIVLWFQFRGYFDYTKCKAISNFRHEWDKKRLILQVEFFFIVKFFYRGILLR